MYGYISGKWPALLVRGNTLTEEQANEVIVRMTDPYWLIGNDEEWGRLTQEAFGLTFTERYDLENYKIYDRECQRIYRELGTVQSEYLGLASRVYSAMIGGSYGWCDWSGAVESFYNVGKWPSVEELTRQWVDVARAFPFLTLRAQVFDCETVEMEGGEPPVAQWTVENGVATLDAEPGPMLETPANSRDEHVKWDAWLASECRERHVSLERLREAVNQVRRTYVPEDADGNEHNE